MWRNRSGVGKEPNAISYSSKRGHKKHIEFSFGNCLHKLFSLQFIISMAINFMLGQGSLFPLSFPSPLSLFSSFPVPALVTLPLPPPSHFLAPQGLAWRRQITGNTFLHSKLVCPASCPTTSPLAHSSLFPSPPPAHNHLMSFDSRCAL